MKGRVILFTTFMRIIAGSAKGRALATPRNHDVIRPTADRVRETLFNVLGQRCDGWRVLDVFAGTGALGLEALSRGAEKVVFVDSGREAVALCKENLTTLGFDAEILQLEWSKGVSTLQRRGDQFEVIFVDPPYRLELGVPVLTALSDAGLLAQDGSILFEHAKHERMPVTVGRFERVDERRFGETVTSIYRYAAP